MGYREQVNKWLASNPLRQWRTENKLYLKDVGAALGVGYHTVYRWENGMATPNDRQLNALIELTGDKELADKFQKWIMLRPVLGKGEMKK